ncbi:MAG: indole-3-glycerol phosphate synthase TrpC [Candidatus Eremiobacteraeota bacterium]|nr:indole-3-glycerol phosphate synthase TrpC [Candidatus Eremiobacteraeota bacterium]
MKDMLKKLYSAKARVLSAEQARESLEELMELASSRISDRRSFYGAIESAQGPAIVAEVKRASPSAGIIRSNFNLEEIATQYERSSCDAISVLTETDYFMGDLAFLERVRNATSKPLLRKDFLWTEYQVVQSAAYGADALLLIVAGLTVTQLREMLGACTQWNMDVLVEVHDLGELERAVLCGARLIGINNRNLRTLETDLGVTEQLLPHLPPGVAAISESGLQDPAHIATLYRLGARGFLIGEAFMRAQDCSSAIDELKHGRMAG